MTAYVVPKGNRERQQFVGPPLRVPPSVITLPPQRAPGPRPPIRVPYDPTLYPDPPELPPFGPPGFLGPPQRDPNQDSSGGSGSSGKGGAYPGNVKPLDPRLHPFDPMPPSFATLTPPSIVGAAVASKGKGTAYLGGPVGLGEVAGYQPRNAGNTTGELVILEPDAVRPMAQGIAHRIQMGWTDGLLQYSPLKQYTRPIVLFYGLTADEEKSIIQATQGNLAGIISGVQTGTPRADRLAKEMGIPYAYIANAQNIYAGLERQTVQFQVQSANYALTATGSDSERRARLIVLCQSKPWKEKCREVGMFDDSSRPSPAPEAPPGWTPPPLFIPPTPLPPVWTHDPAPFIPEQPQPPVYFEPPVNPPRPPLPVTDIGGEETEEQRRQRLIVLCTSTPWKEKCAEVGMYNPALRPGSEMAPGPVPPVETWTLPGFDSGVAPPFIAPPPGGDLDVAYPSLPTPVGSGSGASAGDPNLIFGFPKQHVLLGVAVVAGLMLFKGK